MSFRGLIIVLAAAAFSCSLLVAAESQTAPQQAGDIVGTWVLSYQGQEYVYDFRPDGTLFFNNQQGQYSYSGGQLTTYLGGQTVNYMVRISGDTMWLTYGGAGGSTMELKRRGGGQQGQQGGGLFSKPQTQTGAAAGGQGLVGTWVTTLNGQEVVLVLGADGMLELSGQRMPYSVSGNQIIVNLQGQNIAYNYQLSGNTLVVSGGDITTPLQFTRRAAATQQQQMSSQQSMAYDVYTFQSDNSVRIGYPRGWTVQEHQLGATILERQTTDTAGVEVLLGTLQQGVHTKEAFADSLINNLRQSTFPDIAITNRQTHPQSADLLVLDISYSSNNIPYLSRAWTTINLQAGVGIFIIFYAPSNRYQSFNPDEILLNCFQPMIGGQQPIGPGGAP